MGSTRVPEPGQGQGQGQQLLLLAVCCLSVLLGSLDTTILNVALPAIRQDVNPSATRLQWRLDACTIALATLLTSAGSAADRLGRKRVFRPGLMPVHRRHLPLSHVPLHPARLLTSVGQEAGGVEAQAGACRL